MVKGIADFADGTQLVADSWSSCASVIAASLVKHILINPVIFRCWPHYNGNYAKTSFTFLYIGFFPEPFYYRYTDIRLALCDLLKFHAVL